MNDILKFAKDVVTYVPRNTAYFFNNQFQTIKNVKQVDDNIFLMDYKYDYDLDGLLETGVSNTGELVAYACKKMTFGAKLLGAQDGEFGCSSFSTFNAEGDCLLGRNFDYKDAPCFFLWTAPKNGYKSLSATDCNFMLCGNKSTPVKLRNRLQTLLAPYCCVDGMNEKGLSIAVLEIKTKATKQETGKKPITTTVLVRTVLDKAATVDEALEIFKSYDLHDAFGVSYHYHIADASGKSVLVEYIDNEMVLVEPVQPEGCEKPFRFATNYFITEGGDNKKGQGFDRADRIRQVLTRNKGIISELDSIQLLDDVHLDYRHRTGLWQVTTLWSAVYNMNKLKITLAAGLNYGKVYELDFNKPLEAKRIV